MDVDSTGGTPLYRMFARKPDGHRIQLLRPLVLSPAVLYHPVGQTAWRVDLADTDTLTPHLPPDWREMKYIMDLHRAVGHRCRVALALASPMETTLRGRPIPPGSRVRARCIAKSDIYGWSIMYQRPGCPLEAFIDSDDDNADLPAFYENAAEVLDRTSFLITKRVPHRVLALVTMREDFEWPFDPVLRRNRFFPEARFAAPTDITRTFRDGGE